jgi:hypothetical protein
MPRSGLNGPPGYVNLPLKMKDIAPGTQRPAPVAGVICANTELRFTKWSKAAGRELRITRA